MSHFDMVLPFDTDSLDFRRGVEVGLLWSGVQSGHHRFTVHTDIAEMVLRVADCSGLTVVSTELNDDFMHVEFA